MCLAIPVKIVEINGSSGICELGGVAREANLTFIEDPEIGDYVLLHAGFAIQKLKEEEALDSLKVWKELEELK